MFGFLGLHTVFYRTHIDNSSLWTEVIYFLYKYSINNNNNNKHGPCKSMSFFQDIFIPPPLSAYKCIFPQLDYKFIFLKNS
jgi:hypothetical protein